MKMIRPLACGALAAALFAAVPAIAQTTPSTAAAPGMNCSEAGMKTAHDSMMKMTDAAKKTAVTKEMDMARDMMAKKDEKGCMAHMDKAAGMMK